MEIEKITRLLDRQKALANFGSFAFRENRLPLILEEAARITSICFGAPLVKVCRFRLDQSDLIVEAGFGWGDDIVGQATQKADRSSPGGRALVSGEPVIIHDLRYADDFVLPSFYDNYSIISTVNVIIKGVDGESWGVLEIDSPDQQDYDEYDIDFLTGFANVLAEAVATATRISDLKKNLIEKELLLANQSVLMIGQDKLITQNQVLTGELQRRVRNNLQSIYMLLHQGKLKQSDPNELVKNVADRVLMLFQVYENLAEDGIGSAGLTVDYSDYLKTFCASLAEFYSGHDGKFEIAVKAKSFFSDIGQITSMCLIISELVYQSFDHGAAKVKISFDYPFLIIEDEQTTLDDGSQRLSMIRQLIDRMHGVLEICSQDGKPHWKLTLPPVV